MIHDILEAFIRIDGLFTFMLRQLFLFGLLVFAFSFALNIGQKGTPSSCNTNADCNYTTPGYTYECKSGKCIQMQTYTCNTDVDCQTANVGNTCMTGICGNAQQPAQCTKDSDCQSLIPGPKFLCQKGQCVAGNQYLCGKTTDCTSAKKGTVCANGICTSAAQPLTCKKNSDCPNTVPGPEFVCTSGSCNTTGGYMCNNDQQCPSSKGNECISGKCAWSQKQNPLCPVSMLLLFLVGVFCFKFSNN